jgi:hypothetical protein
MSGEATAGTPTQEQPSEQSKVANLQKVWTELSRNQEGVGLTVYEQYEDNETVVRDETWWPWSEFTGMADDELEITETGLTQMNAIRSGSVLTADNILDVVFETGLTFVNFGELKGDIDGEPAYEEMEIPSEEAVQAELKKVL